VTKKFCLDLLVTAFLCLPAMFQQHGLLSHEPDLPY